MHLLRVQIAQSVHDMVEPKVVPVANVQHDSVSLLQPQFEHHFKRSTTTSMY